MTALEKMARGGPAARKVMETVARRLCHQVEGNEDNWFIYQNMVRPVIEYSTTEDLAALLRERLTGMVPTETLDAVTDQATDWLRSRGYFVAKLEEPDPKRRDLFAVSLASIRYIPYSSRSDQFRNGIKGRWQITTSEYGGWQNINIEDYQVVSIETLTGGEDA